MSERKFSNVLSWASALMALMAAITIWGGLVFRIAKGEDGTEPMAMCGVIGGVGLIVAISLTTVAEIWRRGEAKGGV